MKQRKIYYRRKKDKIIAEGKRGKKTIFLFTLPTPDELVKSSLFSEEKKEKLRQKIDSLDIMQPKQPKQAQELRTVDVVGTSEKDDSFDVDDEIQELSER